jgi:serine/threonine protein phosphatase PrpC
MDIWHVSVESVGVEHIFRWGGHGGINSEFVEGVREEDNFLQESVQSDSVFSKSFHMVNSINTSLLAHSSEVVVVGLEEIPVVSIQLFQVGDSVFILGNNNTLIFFNSSHNNVHGYDCLG